MQKRSSYMIIITRLCSLDFCISLAFPITSATPCPPIQSFSPGKQIIIYSLVMGQQDSRPQLSQKTSPRNINYYPSNKPSPTPTRNTPLPRRVECEGVLKLQATPFKNCIEIETEQEVLFLQAVELTLRQLLQGRLHTNKLFLAEDIDRLIEGVIYALAHLQTHGVTYKDIDPENIFYDQGNFKLLPNELICLNTYQKLREGTPVLPSPELIIALRCGEEEVVEEDILEKSNVFTLGMVLLEVCTLLPSEECYDSDNYDILDQVINERVLLVEEYYGERVAKIVANMLDYDYTERMNLKDLSIWVNRQLSNSKAETDTSHNPHLPSHPTAPQSVLASKVERTDVRNNNTGGVDKSRSRLVKNNSVYMNVPKEDQCREERNKIYINDTTREEPPRVFGRGNEGPANRHYRMETTEKPPVPERFLLANQSLNESDTYKFNQSLPLRDRPQNHPYQVNQDYKAPQYKKEPAFERSLLDRDTVTKRITKQPARPFRGQPEELQKASSSSSTGNQYYPNIDEILKNKPDLLRGIRGPSESSSLSRIKSQIERSKKLVEQIKQNEIRS